MPVQYLGQNGYKKILPHLVRYRPGKRSLVSLLPVADLIDRIGRAKVVVDGIGDGRIDNPPSE
jgi:hypothetical protein